MTTLTGKELEKEGKEVFTKFGFTCVANLANAQLNDIDPTGLHASGEHLELDYLIPQGKVCLVGEITGRTANHAKNKYSTFRRHFALLVNALDRASDASRRENLWRSLGVAHSETLRLFRDVEQIKGFFIMNRVEKGEADFASVSPIQIFYRYDWHVLQEYAVSINRFGKYQFLDNFGIEVPTGNVSVNQQYAASQGQLLAACDRFVTSNRDYASHVLTLLANPYDLISISRVCRRDALPSLAPDASRRYQRMLIPQKLKLMREQLLRDRDFMFPNGILAVLSNRCTYNKQQSVLTIPNYFGALNIIDGQHRLFAYAADNIQRIASTDARILVTAICFDQVVDEAYVQRFSARTFIEINTNQTKVSSSHLYGIAYEVLGQTDHRSLAAHILRHVNARNNKVRGLLYTPDSPAGKIKTMEIVGSLGALTNISNINKLQQARGKSATNRKQGFEQLFGSTLEELADADRLASRGIITAERYLNLIARIFDKDWPSLTGPSNNSAFELSKFIAGLVRLFRQFVDEGANWQIVGDELGKIRDNVKKLRKIRNYNSALFNINDKRIPDARARISDNYKFLNANRTKTTAIGKIVAKR